MFPWKTSFRIYFHLFLSPNSLLSDTFFICFCSQTYHNHQVLLLKNYLTELCYPFFGNSQWFFKESVSKLKFWNEFSDETAQERKNNYVLRQQKAYNSKYFTYQKNTLMYACIFTNESESFTLLKRNFFFFLEEPHHGKRSV